MLYAITIENAHRFGDVMPQLFRLRYRQFKERQSYNVRVHRNMEFDQYDTPETVYLVWLDEQNRVRGTSRLNPTCSPYMLKDLWSHMIDGHDLPNAPDVWEGTRICIDKDLPGPLRERIKWEIVLGYLEFGLATGITRFVGIMQSFIWLRVFVQSGWGADYLGPEHVIDGIKTRAGQVHVSRQALQRVREKTGIQGRVLMNPDDIATTISSAA
jgi:N-acyl-L-homoserine lactone synthetase